MVDLHNEFSKRESSQTDESEDSESMVFLISSAWELSVFIQIWKKIYSISLFVSQIWFNGIEPLLESLSAQSTEGSSQS